MVSRGKTSNAKRKQTKKVVDKLKKLRKKGKLKRHVMNAYRQINAKKYAGSRQKAKHIEEDWQYDREMKLANEENDDIVPLDMISADIDWEKSAFARGVATSHKEEEDAEASDNLELKKRRFQGEPADDVHELLPIKVNGNLLRRSRKASEELPSNEGKDNRSDEQTDQWKEEDLSGLNAAQLLKKRAELIESAKEEISGCAYALLAQPQLEIHRLRTLLRMCKGEEVHSLVRESVQKLAIVSTAQVFIDIIPGYSIRRMSEEEQSQKLKKETKKLRNFESALLRYYSKYLQFLEKNVMKLLPKKNVALSNENTFTYTLGMVSLRSLCELLTSSPHFNFSRDIISLLVRLSTSKHEAVVDECCEALSRLFASDVTLQHCACGAGAIAAIVKEKKCDVSPKILSTFLKMNIKEVDRGERNTKKQRLLGKRFKLAKERQSKSKAKYAKQLKKLEADLKEVEASESLSKKLKYATEAMKHIFVTYFRVIKHLPTSSLLEPVLEGLSKFAHLLNVEFFDDIFAALQTLVEQQHMRVLDSLHCMHAVFVMLSGEGLAINVDPFRFYKSMYRIMTSVPFEKRIEMREREVVVMLRTLDLMVNARRKQVALCRVAALTKRLLAVSFFLPVNCVVAILAAIRTFYISHPRLQCMLASDEEAATSGLFKADIDDPDCCNALSSTIIAETDLLSKHPDPLIVQLVKNLRAGVPSSGAARLSADISTVKPYEWVERLRRQEADIEPHFYGQISLFCKITLSVTDLQMQSVSGL
ncbi:unnamed protein product [Toxocara canis]|uniref:NOC3-like protein n=1 Tax=Toxocara canis TaxID=6265 RepID=A0A183TWX6_TOXCA|nr:unnamed protein product [Toxocara canis]